jgi:hypothetical protein
MLQSLRVGSKDVGQVTTISNPIARLVKVRNVTRTKAERRTIAACDKIVSNPKTKWHEWKPKKR